MKKLYILLLAILIALPMIYADDFGSSRFVSYYSFEDGSANDSVSYADGTFSGDEANVSGRNDYGSARYFDGVNDWMNITDTVGTNYTATKNFTINVWINATNIGSWPKVYSRLENSNDGVFLMLYNTGKPAFLVDDGVGSCNSNGDANTTFQGGIWEMLTATYDGTTMTTYRNGEPINTTGCTLTPDSTRQSAIWGAKNDGSEDFQGGMDDPSIGLWMTAQEVKDLYNNMSANISYPFTTPVEDELPVPVLNEPSNNAWTHDNTPPINFTVTDADTPQLNCTLYFNNTAYAVNNTVANATKTAMTVNESLANGTYNWLVECDDGTSWVNTSARSLNIGNRIPYFDLWSNVSNATTIYSLTLPYTTTSFNLSVFDDDSDTLTSDFIVNGLINISTGSLSNNDNTTPGDFSVGTYGTYTWTFNLSDGYEVNTSMESFYFVISNFSVYTSTFVKPNNTDPYENGESFQIQFNLTDQDSNLKTGNVTLDYIEVNGSNISYGNSTTDYTLDWVLFSEFPSALTEDNGASYDQDIQAIIYTPGTFDPTGALTGTWQGGLQNETWFYYPTNDTWINRTNHSNSYYGVGGIFFDVVNRRHVKVVGYNGTGGDSKVFYEFNASNWEAGWDLLTISGSYPNQDVKGNCYDSKRNIIWIYGGALGGQSLWAINLSNNSATDRSADDTGDIPGDRYHIAIAYNNHRDTCMLFGGRDGSTDLSGFYEFNITNMSWTQTTPTVYGKEGRNLSARSGTSSAYHQDGRYMVITGGPWNGAELNETYLWYVENNTVDDVTQNDTFKEFWEAGYNMPYETVNNTVFLTGLWHDATPLNISNTTARFPQVDTTLSNNFQYNDTSNYWEVTGHLNNTFADGLYTVLVVMNDTIEDNQSFSASSFTLNIGNVTVGGGEDPEEPAGGGGGGGGSSSDDEEEDTTPDVEPQKLDIIQKLTDWLNADGINKLYFGIILVVVLFFLYLLVKAIWS